MLTIILFLVAVSLIVFLITAVVQPSDFRITRSATLSAPASAIFPHVNELQKWQAWSPWAKLDPNAKNSFEGPAAGNGAKMSWAGNNKIGSGSMTITESHPSELVRFKLEFFKPFKASNVAEFTFLPDGDQTTVTWSMSGKNNYIAKAMGLIVNCDRMVGGQFEQGLAAMKSIVETTG
jgi:Polyketide cyclase / dehydrase and lipid transport